MRSAKLILATAAAIALLAALNAASSAQNKPAAGGGASKPPGGASVDTSGWSGRSGSSGNPIMSVDAIKFEAANFKKCIENEWPQAQRRGVSRATFDTFTAKLTPDLQIMDLLDNQPEFAKPIWDYVDALVTDDRIAQGKAVLDQYRDTFDAVEKASGVDRYVIAAIWGVETNFGKSSETRPVIRSTATLACVGRRQGYFREEFVTALEILQQGDIAPERFNGNWVGAFGGTQFMPTTYKRFAVDFDHDGKRNIVDSVPDMLASTAKALKAFGWRAGQAWGYEITLPQNFNYFLANGPSRTVERWGASGVTLADGRPLPQDKHVAAVLLPAGADGPAFLVLGNFQALLNYNPAESYALTVAALSDRLRGGGPFVHAWPRDARMLTAAERFELQDLLLRRGLLFRAPSGRLDQATRYAVQKFQSSNGMTPDGFATAAVLERLRM
jgi:membrane-bound lytic murein transglycosylase B